MSEPNPALQPEHENPRGAEVVPFRSGARIDRLSRRKIAGRNRQIVESTNAAASIGGTVPTELLEPGRRAGLLRFFAENHGKAIFDLTLRAIQEKAVLLDASDLSLRVLGRLAAEYQNTKTFELEILQLSKTVIDELIADLNSGRATGIPIPGDFAILGSRESAGDACRAFNGLPEHERTILYQIFIQKVPKARVAAQHGLDEALLASMVSGLLQQIVVRLRGPA